MKDFPLLAAVAFSILFFSCKIDRDYDFGKEVIGDTYVGGEMQIPIGSSKEITLFRNHTNDSSSLSLLTYDNDDFYLKYDLEDELWPFKIPQFDITPSKNTYDIFTMKVLAPMDDFGTGESLPFYVSSDFIVNDNDFPAELVEVKEIKGNADFVSKILFDNTPTVISAITLQKGMKVEFPQWCCISSYDESLFKRLDSHTFESIRDIRMKNFSYLTLNFTCNRIDFTKFPEGQGLVEPGKLYIDSEIILDGYFTVSSSDVTVSKPTNCEIGITVSNLYSSFSVDEVTARIDPGASISVNPMKFNELKDIGIVDLEESVIDITDGFVALDIYSGIPLDVLFSANVKAYDRIGRPTADLEIPGNSDNKMVIASGMHSRYCLTEGASSIPEGYTPMNVPGLSDMIRRWPYKICTEKISLSPVDDDFITIKVGDNEDQNVILGGYVEIPLRFGTNLRIEMETESFDFGFEIGDDLVLSEGELCMDIINTIPLQVDISFVEASSKASSSESICLLPGTPDNPSKTAVSIPVSPSSGNLQFKTKGIVITCPEDFSGMSLNCKQGITLENIMFSVHKGISVRK